MFIDYCQENEEVSIEDLDAQCVLNDGDVELGNLLDKTSDMHLDELQDIATIIQENEASPQTLAYAMERMDCIASLYQIQTLGLAREGFVDMALQKGTDMKDEVVRRAYKVSQGILASILQKFQNTVDRMKINVKSAFSSRSAHTRAAQKLKERCSVLRNAQLINPDARYTKQIHIAHFTKGDKTIIASGGEILHSLKTNYDAFKQVGHFMGKFADVFDFQEDAKGVVNFTQLAEGFVESKFFPHQFTLSGEDALFGEEFLLSEFSGQANNVRDMITIVRGMRTEHEYIWRVKELDHVTLDPVHPHTMARDIDRLSEAGAYIYEFCRNWDHIIGKHINNAMNRQNSMPWDNLEFYGSPKNYLLYNRLYIRVIMSLGDATGKAISTNDKAIFCFLDYYKWSLDQFE
jgi:hypothetical protein